MNIRSFQFSIGWYSPIETIFFFFFQFQVANYILKIEYKHGFLDWNRWLVAIRMSQAEFSIRVLRYSHSFRFELDLEWNYIVRTKWNPQWSTIHNFIPVQLKDKKEAKMPKERMYWISLGVRTFGNRNESRNQLINPHLSISNLYPSVIAENSKSSQFRYIKLIRTV